MLRSIVIATILTLAASQALAQQSTKVGYQGRLEDAATGPLTGNYDFWFTLYDAATGGNNKWTETQTNVPVAGGAFTVKLGSVTPLPNTVWPDNTNLYLAIAVKPNGTTSWVQLQNRQEIVHVPRAVQAEASRVCASRTFSFNPAANTQFTEQYATCLSGEKIRSGGHSVSSAQNIFLNSYPDIANNRWVVSGFNARGDAPAVTVYAVCCP